MASKMTSKILAMFTSIWYTMGVEVRSLARTRAHGEGTIWYDAKRDEYIGQIRDGKKADGSPNRRTFHSGKGGKKSDVAAQIRQWRIAKEQGYVNEHAISLDEGIKAWLTIIKKPDLKPTSYDRLESIIDCQVLPRIGQYNVAELTDGIIREELLDAMEKDGLSLSSLKKAYNALREYLNYAAYYSVILRNPMGMMKAPKPSGIADAVNPTDEEVELESGDQNVDPLTIEETQSLVAILSTKWKTGNLRYPMGSAFLFLLNTGLRIGELLALKWSDVDLNTNNVSITKNLVLVKNRDENATKKYKLIIQNTPKTKKSRRQVPLNKKALQALQTLKNTTGYSDNGYIVHTETGNPMLPRSFEQTLDLASKAAKLRKMSPHTLRHTYATRLFERGVDVKVVSELLGHSSTEVTYRIYIHVLESIKKDAVATAFDLDDE